MFTKWVNNTTTFKTVYIIFVVWFDILSIKNAVNIYVGGGLINVCFLLLIAGDCPSDLSEFGMGICFIRTTDGDQSTSYYYYLFIYLFIIIIIIYLSVTQHAA